MKQKERQDPQQDVEEPLDPDPQQRMFWNALKSIKNWKQQHEWTLFVVESNPTLVDILVEDSENLARSLFNFDGYSTAICIPFTGGFVLERVIRSLTTSHQDMIQLVYSQRVKMEQTQNVEWVKLMDKTRGFTVEDTFHLYHDLIRQKALEQEQVKGLPVRVQFSDIAHWINSFKPRFEKLVRERMEFVAHSQFNQSIYGYQTGKMEIPKYDGIVSRVVDSETFHAREDGKEEDHQQHQNSNPKGTFMYVLFTIFMIFLALVIMFACGWM